MGEKYKKAVKTAENYRKNIMVVVEYILTTLAS